MPSSDSPGSNYWAALRIYPYPLAMFHACYLYLLGSQVLAQKKTMAIYDPTAFPTSVSRQYD